MFSFSLAHFSGNHFHAGPSVGIEGYRSIRRLHFPLRRLIAKAAERTQVWVVTHSQILADTLEDAAGVRPQRVYKQNGETLVEGIDTPGVVDDDDG